MKKSLIVVGLLAAGLIAKADGTFTVLNVGQSILDVDGVTKLAKANGAFEVLYNGVLVQGSSSTVFPATGAGKNFSGNGLISSGGDPLVIPGASAGSTASITIRAWDKTTGATYDTALHRGSETFLTDGLGGGATPPGGISGFKSFSLTVVPEPSTIALAALGLGGLVLVSRRK